MHESLQSEMSQSLSAGSDQRNQAAAARKHKHVVSAVKIQWRAALLAVIAIITVLFYWIFYFTQMGRLTGLATDDNTILSWLECMLENNGDQNQCVDIVSPHLPPFGLMITAEALVSLIGIWVFLIFGKRSLWREWNDLIYDIRVSLGARGRREKNGEQFFQL